MCITEYNEKTFVEGIRAEGRVTEIFSSVEEQDYSVERGAEKLNMSVKDFKKAMTDAGYKLPG